MSNWSIRIIFDIDGNESTLPILTDIPRDKYAEFHIFLVFLSMIGFIYTCKLNKTDIPNIYSFDSLDLSYWHKLIYNKLDISTKPRRPLVSIDSIKCNELRPKRIEVYDSYSVFNSYQIHIN